MNGTGAELEGSEGTKPAQSRGELYLEKTRMEDEIQKVMPSLKRRRKWGIAITGLGLLNLAWGALTGNLAAGLFSFIIFLVASMVPWLFFGVALSEIRGLKRAAAEIEGRLSAWEEEELNGEV